MSDFTPCNYCTLRRIRRDAKANGKRVTVLDDARWGMGGSNVYVHPPEVKIRALAGGEDGERAKYRCSWMMEIPSRCEC